jgi:hypothetical protein
MLYAAALTDRSVPVPLAAIEVLARYGDRRAVPEVFGWLRRKLRRKSRSANWDPDEVRSVIRFADQNGLLQEAADILVEHLGLLEAEEFTWLGEVWPAATSGALPSTGEVPAPDWDRLAQPLFEDHRMDVSPELEAMWEDSVRKALSSAQRRAARRHDT